MAGSKAILAIEIIADAKKATAGLSQSSQDVSKWQSGIQKAGLVAGAALAGIGAIALSGAKAAAEDAQAQALLASAMEKAAGATASQVAATEAFITKTAMATGVADDQLRPAMATLARATGDVETSQTALSAALDVSAATGKDVETVSAALAKAYAGNTSSLGKLVPGLDKATLASGDMNAIMAELARVTGGSAAGAADTAAGQYARLQVAMDETKESIGAALLPVLQTLMGILAPIATYLSENSTVTLILVGAIAALAATVVAANAAISIHTALTTTAIGKKIADTAATVANTVATTASRVAVLAWAAAQWLLNAAMSANPIGIVIALVVGLVAAIILAYRNSETFRNIVNAAFSAVMGVITSVWNIIKSLASTISGVLVSAFKTLQSIGVSALNLLLSPIRLIQSAISTVVGLVQDLVGWISRIKIPDVGSAIGAITPWGAVPAPTMAPAVMTRAGTYAGPAVRTGTTRARPMPTPVVNVRVQLGDEPLMARIRSEIQYATGAQARRIAMGTR